jgi:hypothetical protein
MLLFVSVLTLLCGSVFLTHHAVAGEEQALRKDCRIGTIEVVVTNTDTDAFITTMQTYDKSLTIAGLQQHAVTRLREMLGVSGANLLSETGQGGKLTMELTFSGANWTTVRRGDKVSEGVRIAGVSTIDWADGATTIQKADGGWVKRTDSQLEAAKKSIDLHVGLLLVALAGQSAKPDTLLLLLPEILPVTRCGEVCGKYQEGNIFDVLSDLAAKRGVDPLTTLVKHRRDEVRWATIAALGEAGDASAAKTVTAALGDGFWGVREAAASALLELKARDAMPALKQAIAREEDQECRAVMSRVLQQLSMVSVRLVVPPDIIPAADAVFDPGSKLVWCRGEAVLKHFGVQRQLPIGIDKTELFGESYVSLMDLFTRVPELANYKIAADHAVDQGKVYLKARGMAATGDSSAG